MGVRVGQAFGLYSRIPLPDRASSRLRDLPPAAAGAPRSLKILAVATKPPWPPIDGGRLLVRNTLEALAERGHRLTLVAPLAPGSAPAAEVREALASCCAASLVEVRGRSHLTSLVRGRLTGRPLSIDRHSHQPVALEVGHLLTTELWDVVHVEQLQALFPVHWALRRLALAHWSRSPRPLPVPVVLRAQNVESDLWAAAARGQKLLGSFARLEAARLARWEGEAVGRVSTTVALTARDAERLRDLAGGRGRVTVVRAPFAGTLTAADRPLPGAPAVVLMGSEGWPPNQDAVQFFAANLWPAVRAALPEARLHVFGNLSALGPELGGGIHGYPAPADTREVFAPGSILVLPLRIASGVRMRILEAWARGVPVVASPEAAAGLDAQDGRELLLAQDGAEYAAAFARLAAEPGLAARLTAAGRDVLARFHAPAVIVREMEEVYRGAISTSSS